MVNGLADVRKYALCFPTRRAVCRDIKASQGSQYIKQHNIGVTRALYMSGNR